MLEGQWPIAYRIKKTRLITRSINQPNYTPLLIYVLCARFSNLKTSCKTSEVQLHRKAARDEAHGDEGTRTPDLLLAKEALSHLSYIPG